MALLTIEQLEQRFGLISEPFTWYTRNDPVLGPGLDALPHLIDKESILENLRGSSGIVAAAYMTARMMHGKDPEENHWSFGTDAVTFGVVATIGDLEQVERTIGLPFEVARSKTEESYHKANFVSPSGLIATVRQLNPGHSTAHIINKAGLAEIAICELLPDAKAVVNDYILADQA